jgi:hypothetical protein
MRAFIGHCLALLVIVQPWLCCCLAAQVGKAVSPAVVESKPQAAAPQCCCCHEKEQAPVSQEPAPMQPAKPECPCEKEQYLVQTAGIASASSAQIQFELNLPVMLPPAPVTVFSEVVPAALQPDGAVFPFLDARDYLNRCHFLRC